MPRHMGNAVEMQPLAVLLAGVVVIASVGRPLTLDGGGSVGETRVNRCTLAGGVDCGLGSSCARGGGRKNEKAKGIN